MTTTTRKPVTVTVSLANTTDQWLLVGDYSKIISAHATRDEAIAAYNQIGHAGPDGLAGTPYGTLTIAAPGETITGQHGVYLPPTDAERKSWDDELKSMFTVEG